MFPDQIRKAIDESLPVVLPVGVIEYHAEHCAVGVDTLLVVRAVEMLEEELNLVILPPFYYGAASYAVEPPERRGTIHVEPAVLNAFGRELFLNLLRIGFRNVHVILHHQTENFVAGMPTDLAFKLAARQATFELINMERGEGWWGDNAMQDYYAKHEQGENPFNWIQVHPFMDEESQRKFPIDHAGRQETSLMMAFCPEGVDMDRLSEEKWYCAESKQADLKYGNEAKEMILQHLRRILSKSK
jgi:creatinine amidohydrolase